MSGTIIFQVSTGEEWFVIYTKTISSSFSSFFKGFIFFYSSPGDGVGGATLRPTPPRLIKKIKGSFKTPQPLYFKYIPTVFSEFIFVRHLVRKYENVRGFKDADSAFVLARVNESVFDTLDHTVV